MFLLVFALTSIVFSVLLKGWYLSVLWSWLMVPAFGVQPLSIPMCLAISLLIEAFHPSSTQEDKEAKDMSPSGKLVFVVFKQVGTVAFGLLFAYILKGYL